MYFADIFATDISMYYPQIPSTKHSGSEEDKKWSQTPAKRLYRSVWWNLSWKSIRPMQHEVGRQLQGVVELRSGCLLINKTRTNRRNIDVDWSCCLIPIFLGISDNLLRWYHVDSQISQPAAPQIRTVIHQNSSGHGSTFASEIDAIWSHASLTLTYQLQWVHLLSPLAHRDIVVWKGWAPSTYWP